MHRQPRVILGLALTFALATGCQGNPSTPTANGNRPVTTKRAAISPPVSSTLPVIPPPPPGLSPLTPPPTAPLVSNNGSSLMGTVMAPPGLISDHGGLFISNNGGGLISNNGGGLISNNGGGLKTYGLLALEQQPLAGATVAVTDAAGRPVMHPLTQQPLTTIVGADGRYAFEVALPANNLLLEVKLKTGGGVLRAIVPAGADARRNVDVELVGTLTTAYILARYVRTQADDLAQATLDKLPANVERDTRLKAEGALAAGGQLPKLLDDATVLTAVDALRAGNPTFDAQLEVVKRLLVAAGLSDFGNGAIATQIPLSSISDIARLADGTLYIASPADARLWRLPADGRLYAAAGTSPNGYDASLEGMRGVDTALGAVMSLAVTASSGVLFLESNRLSELGTDGIVHARAAGLVGARSVCIDTSGTIWMLCPPVVHRPQSLRLFPGATPTPMPTTTPAPSVTRAAVLWRIPAGGAAEKVHTFDDAGSFALANAVRVVPGPAGRLHIGVAGQASVPDAVMAVDTTTFACTTVTTAVADETLLLDAEGRVWRRNSKTARALTAVGLAPLKLPEDTGFTRFPPFVHQPDGQALLGEYDRLQRLTGTGATLLAGLREPLRDTEADKVVFYDATLLAVDGPGTFRVWDEQQSWLWHIVPGGRAKMIKDLSDGLSEDDASVRPVCLRASADGTSWLLDDSSFSLRIVRVGIDGAASVAWTPPEPDPEVEEDSGLTYTLRDFHAADDGTLTLLVERSGYDDDTRNGLALLTVKNRVTSQAKRLSGPTGNENPTFDPQRLMPAPGNRWYLANGDALWRAEASGTATVLTAGEAFTDFMFFQSDYLTADATGRIFGSDTNTIWRFDPVSLTTVAIAGTDGRLFQGRGVDDGTGYTVLAPALSQAGDLFFLDPDYRQVKRVGRADIP